MPGLDRMPASCKSMRSLVQIGAESRPVLNQKFSLLTGGAWQHGTNQDCLFQECLVLPLWLSAQTSIHVDCNLDQMLGLPLACASVRVDAWPMEAPPPDCPSPEKGVGRCLTCRTAAQCRGMEGVAESCRDDRAGGDGRSEAGILSNSRVLQGFGRNGRVLQGWQGFAETAGFCSGRAWGGLKGGGGTARH